MVLILLPIWKREKITDICLSNLAEIKKKRNIEVLCVVSEQWAKIKAFEYGFKWVEAENFPVGTKLNKGIEHALKRINFKYLMNLGSDDIIKEKIFDIYEPYIKEGREVFGITKITFFDSESKTIKRFDYKHLVGAGRMIKKEVLKRFGSIYPEKNKCLDDGSARNMFGAHFTEIETEEDLIIDIKSAENIWPYEFFEVKPEGLETLNVNDEILTKLIEL